MAGELDLARSLAISAGRRIRESIGNAARVERKSAVNLVTEVDRACEQEIIAGIRAAFAADAIVAEESSPEPPPVGRCWYVDPIDGTTNFVHGFPHCAVSIAYMEDGCVRAAVVHDPCKSETFEAERGHGARLNGVGIHVSEVSAMDNALWVTGFPYDRRTHARFYLEYFKEFLLNAQDVRRLGSAALDLCYVAAGRFDGFWEWKLHPWDTAAGWLIVEEAGGRVSDFDGRAYNPWLPRVLATNGRIHEAAIDLLGRLPQSP